ncbi:MAB_1171c family putative transporter [Nocardia sp. NPDC052566]|uniref:MAB_1171c family putative transporter n=1 Tax=Nocardia sp. NPDC052566 TaxID=3364330 RepID=UPI0037C67A63
MNAVPAPIVASLAVFVALVIGGRWLVVNDTTIDRLINRALIWDVVGLLLYSGAQTSGRSDVAMRLFICCGTMAIAHVYGIARLLGGAPPDRAGVRQRRYNTVAVVVTSVLLIGSAFVALGMPDDPLRWWEQLSWLGSEVLIMLSGLLIARACVHELRFADATPKERLADTALLLLSAYWITAAAIAIVRIVFGELPGDFGLLWATLTFISLLLLAALITVPLVTAVLARTELDGTGRNCRRLRPLWRDLTTAVPEVVLRQGHSPEEQSASRLYRMTVEIWDALLHLRQYTPDPAADPEDVPGFALAMAQAAQAKTAGDLPRVVPAPGGVHADVRDRTTELRTLLELARAWPHARERTGTAR